MHACAVCAQSKRKEANEFYKNELKKKESWWKKTILDIDLTLLVSSRGIILTSYIHILPTTGHTVRTLIAQQHAQLTLIFMKYYLMKIN